MGLAGDIATRPGSTGTAQTETNSSSSPLHVSPGRPSTEAPPGDTIRLALIDGIQFSQDCLVRAFHATHPDLQITPFDSVAACVLAGPRDHDAVVYCVHGDGLSEDQMLQGIGRLKQAFALTPVVVLSDSQVAFQAHAIRNALKSGARGVIPTLNTGVPAVLAALRFIKDGGTFVPLDLLLPAGSPNAPDKANSISPNALTPRQRAVLSHLKQGKANKVIAYELNMSESTVKVHIRNIMRKMGATNRTQAVYKFQHTAGLI